MPTYNKLVRDRIPDIIRKNGKTLSSRILEHGEYVEALKVKFNEEWREYNEASDDTHAVEELADMLEILYSLAKLHGVNEEEVNEVCHQKRRERGGFSDKVFLIEVSDE